MEDQLAACRALYATAFPGEEQAFAATLFSRYAPRHLRVKTVGGAVASMLFSIPYPIQITSGTVDARYLYAVATAPEFRGRGLARALIAEEIARGLPVFLRPMQPSLFAFYARAGLTPFAPHETVCVQAGGGTEGIRALDAAAYRAARAAFLNAPFCQPTEDFLRLSFCGGGAIGQAGVFAALYECTGGQLFIKELLGDIQNAPRVAAFLGYPQATVRTHCAKGTPFGAGANLPDGASFLLALD